MYTVHCTITYIHCTVCLLIPYYLSICCYCYCAYNLLSVYCYHIIGHSDALHDGGEYTAAQIANSYGDSPPLIY